MKKACAASAQILHLSTPALFTDAQNRERLVTSMESFIRMYHGNRVSWPYSRPGVNAA
jgi:hypothetical protein